MAFVQCCCVKLLSTQSCQQLLRVRFFTKTRKRIYRFFTKIEKRIIDPNDPQRKWIL